MHVNVMKHTAGRRVGTNLQRVVVFTAVALPILIFLIYSRKNYSHGLVENERYVGPSPTQRHSDSNGHHISGPNSTASGVHVHSCELPTRGYKGWNDGVVTVMKPIIERNCTKLFAGDERETKRIKDSNEKWRNPMRDKDLLKLTQNCSWLRDTFADNLYNTVLEQSFPFAYTFLLHERPQQVFRLIKLLYRPQNVYCLHYDLKSSQGFKNTFENIAKCFGNIFIASEIIRVDWGASTILTAQMKCLYDLLKYREEIQSTESRKWKYIINLCGKELPLMTGREVVSRLKALNGSSSVMAVRNSSWKRVKPALAKRNITTNSLPYNLTLYKSSSYNALSYQFAHYLAYDPFAISTLNFFQDCTHSEEHFYATLYMNPGTPGGFDPKIPSEKHFSVEAAIWCFQKSCKSLCHGRWYHAVCISAAGDLPLIDSMTTKKGALFHNKYSTTLDHTVMDCLEERVVERNKEEYQSECNSKDRHSSYH